MSLRQLYTYFSFYIFSTFSTKSHLVFYVPYKSPHLDSTGISVFISFDADVKEKKKYGKLDLETQFFASSCSLFAKTWSNY